MNRKIKIKIDPTKDAGKSRGVNFRCNAHEDKREKRKRTRKAKNDSAIRDSYET